MKNNLMIMALAATLLTGNVWKKVNCQVIFFEDGSSVCGKQDDRQWETGPNPAIGTIWRAITTTTRNCGCTND
jgi:hypothetical protein